MTDKKDPKDFDFTDSNDFDFEDEILSKDFNKEDELVDPKHLNDDFDFGDEVVRPVGENVIKRQNTIPEQEIKAANNMRENIKKQNTINEKEAGNVSVPSDEYDFDLDDKDDFDFGSSKPKPTMIRKIDCTSLNETEKDFVCLALTIRDQTKRKNLLSDQLIRMRFVQGGIEDRIGFITDIIQGVVESNRLEKNGKKYFFKALKKSMVDLIVVGLDEEFKELEDLIVDEIDKNS
ncbi:hypothetical protein HB4184_07870 [Pseudomonas putida]|nr:hypothetical protein HB4184_07870 [Pseudomonas putida]